MSTTVPECDGRCCAVFPLGRELAYLQQYARDITDGEQIAAMVIPLDLVTAIERAEYFDLDLDTLAVDVLAPELFTCEHWQQDTRRCGIYEQRPAMCSKYPYGERCRHCGAVGGEPFAQPVADA